MLRGGFPIRGILSDDLGLVKEAQIHGHRIVRKSED